MPKQVPSAPPKLGLGGLRGRSTVTLPNNLVFHCIDHREIEGMYREIFEEEVYAKAPLKFTDGMVIVDVGANVGMSALYFSRRSKNSRVYAFEPLPPTYATLRKNIEQHSLENVKSFPFGLSQKAQSAEFSFYPYSPGWSTMHRLDSPEFLDVIRRDIRGYDRLPAFLRWAFATPVLGKALLELIIKFKMQHKTFTCQLKTLSQVIAENGLDRIDLLKVDVERAELSVLEGIESGDWPKIQQLVVETQDDMDPRNTEKITRLLESKGFKVLSQRANYLLDDKGVSFNATLYAVR